MQVGLDLVASANCKSKLQFHQTNKYQLLYSTSSTYFQSAAAPGRRNTEYRDIAKPPNRSGDITPAALFCLPF
jgi:hypothetical protein